MYSAWKVDAMSSCKDNVLHYTLRFHQVLGLHTLPLAGEAAIGYGCSAVWLRCWSCCLLVSFSCLCLHCLTSEQEILYRGDLFGRFNDGMKFGFAELAIVAIYMETLVRRWPLTRFWQLYAALQTTVVTWKWRQLVSYLVRLHGMLLAELVTLLLYWKCQETSEHLLLFWVSFQPFVCLVHLRNMQHIYYLDLLRQQLQRLESELALLAECSRFASTATFAGFEPYLRRQLRQKQLLYGRIYELYSCFLDGFSYSVLAVLLMIYVRVLVDCYFMYYTIYMANNHIDYYLMAPALLQIPAFIRAAQCCMHTIKRIAYQLHSIVACSPSLSLQLQNFSLQILHQPMQINCLGVGVLDGYLLTQMVCSVTTYMIFFIQFMPKLGNSLAVSQQQFDSFAP